MRLMRETRFHLAEPQGESRNSYAGYPTAEGFSGFIAVQTTVRGEVGPESGYLCDIQVLDSAVRDQVVPLLVADKSGAIEALLPVCWERLRMHLPNQVVLSELRIALSPYLSYTLHEGENGMVFVTQSFEFSAAHRLHCATWSDEDNHKIFGKCNNPHGHGHNYQIDVTIKGQPDAKSGRLISLGVFNSIVNECVISVFDHKNLNVECPDFAQSNPTVENIAAVIGQRLSGQFESAELHGVRVWETPKTAAEWLANNASPQL